MLTRTRNYSKFPTDNPHAGTIPTHPELLDWLSNWLIHDAEWSLKKLHRLILTSRTYRSQSTRSMSKQTELFGAFPRQRLRAEVLYDSVLSSAGILSDEMYGSPVHSHLPEQVLSTLTEKLNWNPETGLRRRAVYHIVLRNLYNPFLELFDFPTTSRSCSLRPSTINASQALMLWNSEFIEIAAKALGERISSSGVLDQDSQIRMAFELTLGREPDQFELECLNIFLTTHCESSNSSLSELGTLTQMCMVIFNLSEFQFLH